MYPGRSSWTRGVLALGVGALFLLGWRIDSRGDALSASSIDSDRNYFSVVVVSSSGSNSRHNDREKKEDRLRDGLRTGRQDRQASRGDYSASDEETWTPSNVAWNVEADGEHGASYLEERSLPLWNLEGKEKSYGAQETLPSGNGKIDGREDYDDRELTGHSMESSFPLWNLVKHGEKERRGEVGNFIVQREIEMGRDDGENRGEIESFVNEQQLQSEKLMRKMYEKEDRNNDELTSDSWLKQNNVKDRGEIENFLVKIESKGYRKIDGIGDKSGGELKRRLADNSSPSWKQKGKDNGAFKNFISQDESSSPDFKGNYRNNQDEDDDEITFHSVKKLFSSRNIEEDEESHSELIRYSNFEENFIKNNNDDSTNDLAKQSFPPLNRHRNVGSDLENEGKSKTRSTNKLSSSGTFEKDSENKVDQKLTNFSIENSSLVSKQENPPVNEFHLPKNVSQTSENQNVQEVLDSTLKRSFPLSNPEKTSIENKSSQELASVSQEIFHLSHSSNRNDNKNVSKRTNKKIEDSLSFTKNSPPSAKHQIEEQNTFAFPATAKELINAEDGNDAALNHQETESPDKQDRIQISKAGDALRSALNGSLVGERSDVNENLSREVNGQSMNEARKSSGQSNYSSTSSFLTPTLQNPFMEISHKTKTHTDVINSPNNSLQKFRNVSDKIATVKYSHESETSLAIKNTTTLSTKFSAILKAVAKSKTNSTKFHNNSKKNLSTKSSYENKIPLEIKPTTNRRIVLPATLKDSKKSESNSIRDSPEKLHNIRNENGPRSSNREAVESILATWNIEKNADVEFSNEIRNFHNSAGEFSSVTADGEEEYKRGEESMLGSVDSPAATRRPGGMHEDRVLFFHEDHRLLSSSAKTSESLRSRKGRVLERDRGNILERGTRETRSRDRLPGASDPSVDFREIDVAHEYSGTFDGYEITGREDRRVSSVRETHSASSPLPRSRELFDEEITEARVASDKRFGARREFGKENVVVGDSNLRDEFFGDGVMELDARARKFGARGIGRKPGGEDIETVFVVPVKELAGKSETEEGNFVELKLGSEENSARTKVGNNGGEEFVNIGELRGDLKLGKMNSLDVPIGTRRIENKGTSIISSDEKLGFQNEVVGTRGFSEQLNLVDSNILPGSRDEESLLFLRKIAQREKETNVRRKRYTNYYSPQSATPMAYVHIQPMYPVPAPPTPNRKCVQCMVVYKPCPSAPRPPYRNVLPTYKYQELASKWHGLKYGCRCNSVGSMTSACDIVTGQCQCKSYVTGRQCDQCMTGFWGLITGLGCAPCECDPIGSHNSSCHDTTGQCYCKPGVGGTRCDTCLPGYYGFSSNGCQVCDTCRRPGHICDPDTGRCVCPTLTFGEHCDRCRPGSWDLVPQIGCRPCACTLGSMRPHCDLQGQCPCRIGYDGLRCERCAKGYYGYPRCRPCSCNPAGTLQRDGVISDCNDDGQCPCKEHVVGRQCNQCKEGTFGLTADNPKGCTECFCFGRTTSCQQAGLSWGQRRLTRPRTLYVNDTSNDIIVSKFHSQISLSPINGGLNVTNDLSVIPDVECDVTIPSNLYYNYPLYWMLPESFLGDKVVSYGGFLRFTTSTEGGIPLRSTFQYPIVQLQGNGRIVLEYYLPEPASDNHYEIRFHESLWQLQNRPDYKVTREVLMVALQNLQYILIKASANAEFTKTTLLEASLDAAVLTPAHTPPIAMGIEICQCPPEYNSTSCQDPSIGYYRWYKNTTVTSTIVIDLIGEAKRCQCNGRSNVCDIETGHCMNCRGNTAGPRCDVCSDSFYGHPDFGCKPCPCPQVDKRYSSTCMVFTGTEPICVCKPGYTGRKCERCSPGYFGFPQLPDGKCVPCSCNPAGSTSHECDSETGQCRCRPGSTGRDCSQCTAYRHVYINNICTSCNDNCTGILLDTLAVLSQELAEGTTHIANGYIPPPWEDLSCIDANATMLFEEIDVQNRLKQRMKNIPWHEHRKLMSHVEKLLKTANEHAKRADNLESRSGDLKNNIFSSKIEIDNLRKYIEDTTLFLNQYSNDNKRIEIKKALKMGKMILNSLKTINLTKRTMEIENFLEDVADYTDWLNSLYDATEPLAVAQDEAEEYSVKLNDMRNLIEDTMETLFTYDGRYNNINETLVEVRNYCGQIKMLSNSVNYSVTEGEKLIEETRGFVIDFQNDIHDLPELRNKLTYWFDKLSMKEELLYRLNYEYNDTYVIPAIAHVKNLTNYVDQYVSLFSETRNIAASPLKASQAYKNIADSIKSAKITRMEARNIAENTYTKIFPDGPNSKSLLDNAKEVAFESSRQLESTMRHGKSVQDADDSLQRQKDAVNILKNTLNNTGIRDNEVNIKLQKLQSDSVKLGENIQITLKKNEEISENIKETQKLIEDYEEGITNRLKPKLYELKREGDSKISLASEKLSEALSNIKKADAKLISLSNAAMKRKNAFDKWNDTLAGKLQNLKDKIAEARNTADGIRVSLKSKEGKECIRSYRPSTLQPTSTNTIVMTFALPKGRKEGSLFYLPSSINDDFIALEIINRRVRFLWNVGGGTGILTHPEVIESGDFQDDKFWYRIEAERVRHLGKLYVRKQASTTGRHPTVTNKTDSEYSRFDITTLDRVWIGGIPKSQRRRIELMAPNGLPGCVHQVILDGKPVGLWNFISTAPDEACVACVEGVEDARDDTAYHFNGEGYAVRNRVSSGPYNKFLFGVSISFKTYDENALLFLAINPANNRHIMIFLREGKVVLHIGYGGNVSMEMSSMFKHNTGNWTKVDAFRHYQVRDNIEQCSINIGGDADKKIGAPAPQPKKEDIPDFNRAKYYFGGVPPSFRAEKLMLPSQVSFLGCMSNIVVQEGYDPMAEQYYGVEPVCSSKPLKIVGFYGDGYLQHSAYTLRKINSTVSFSFRTIQNEAVLLLSTFEGQEDRMPNIRHQNDVSNRENYYSICIINGQVQVRLNAGRGELVLQSNGTFNDGRYHSVTLIKKRKDVELRIDDAYQSAGKLPTSAAIRAPEGSGGLYFGGLPILINNTKMIATTTPLYGAIKDAIFNDNIVRFDKVVNFEHALIGRPGPSMGKDPPTYAPSASLSRGMSTEPEGCQKVPYYSLEAGALKFGDKPNSHTQLYLNFKKFWEKKYAIEFDFRTYYPNGLLFITPGLRPKHYLMVVIRDGQLLLLAKSKQKKEILFKTPFNDGNWHHVVISHDERKLTLLVDTQTPRTVKVPRKIGLASMMYIGGLPDSGTPIPEQVVVKLETLKGCIRGLKINGNVYDMVGSTSRAYQVGQCFPNVESGAYFQDEAYAIYKRNFELGAVLELQLEFRTSELSGVLLSITAPGNSPSLSLELNNGKVIMSGDLGDNNPLYVEQRFTSPYTICDNRWHRIQAIYNDEELALKVDEMDHKYGLPANVNYHIMDSTASGPLYIGGLPASAPKGTLITRDHFNGCIRNVMIGGERRDWTDMDELHNIHLSSCPVQ